MDLRATYQDLRTEIKTCDILLYQGKNWFSRAIRWVIGSPYSHAGIVVWWNDRLMVIEAVGKGVVVTPLSQNLSHYKGPVPYSFGWVELPEGIRVETLFTGCAPENLKIGMKVEMVLEKLHEDDEGNEIICHKFRPIEE